jgi:hypothetical protein
MSLARGLVRLALLVGLFGVFAQVAHAVTVVVSGNSTPWDQTVNPLFTFGTGIPNAPGIVTNAELPFAAGDTLLIHVLSGGVSAFPPQYPIVDANGALITPGTDPNAYVGPVNGDPGSSGNGFPSKYMGPYPPDINLMELVGTFADSSGKIVGTPFFVGSDRTRIVPVGATRLQLGINDDVYNDNGGSFLVSVANVPEPGAGLLVLFGLGVLVLVGKRRVF